VGARWSWKIGVGSIWERKGRDDVYDVRRAFKRSKPGGLQECPLEATGERIEHIRREETLREKRILAREKNRTR